MEVNEARIWIQPPRREIYASRCTACPSVKENPCNCTSVREGFGWAVISGLKDCREEAEGEAKVLAKKSATSVDPDSRPASPVPRGTAPPPLKTQPVTSSAHPGPHRGDRAS